MRGAVRESLQGLQCALHRTTELLAGELNRPTRNVPDWSANEWAVAQAAAAIHGVAALLAATLQWQGPPRWRQFLLEQKAHTAQRFLRMQRLLQLIDGRARGQGIGLIALKGAALHAGGLYAPGERPMSDVDLLVREEQAPRTVQLLAEFGFHESDRTWKHQVFERSGGHAPVALGEHYANDLRIELHCSIRELLPLRSVDVSQVVFPQRMQGGLNAYPSKVAALLHVLLHAAGAMIHRELRLLHLIDIARLSRTLTDEEWAQVLREGARTAEGSLWWAFPPLSLAARYFSCVPQQVLDSTASDCHWLLKRVCRRRTLSEASGSHLWISAFPGIEWSRTPRELLAYAAARAAPSTQDLQQRKLMAIAQPRISGGAWAGLSQGQRMLRWAVSRQARQETLAPVRAALDHAH